MSTRLNIANCILVCFFVVSNCGSQCADVNAINQFLVTISGSNMSASDVLLKLKFLLKAINGKADDVNECRLIADMCDGNATCINTLGSYACACGPGYTYVLNEGAANLSQACVDLDECSSDIHNCSSKSACSNVPGSYVCQCSQGYTGDGFHCLDFDECQQDDKLCHRNAECLNTDGSFTCVCSVGFETDGKQCKDVNECLANPCPINTDCTNNFGNYSCNCKIGFVWSGNECEDLNECEIMSVCDLNADCINTAGSFGCICKSGFLGDGWNCADIDECYIGSIVNSEDEPVCHEKADCTNFVGSYSCVCKLGFSGNGRHCEDIDECASFNGDCHENSLCLNTAGSFSCECKVGFNGDGLSYCEDLDECLQRGDYKSCGVNAECVNTEGSFECLCLDGFETDGINCKDLDECQMMSSICDANADCVNNPGSFDCVCNSGYLGDGRNCEDVDECLSGEFGSGVERGSTCHLQATCTNHPGSFTCTCVDGFLGDGMQCQDLDECAAVNEECHVNALCLNVPGSFTCQCKVGFNGDGFSSCQDIDECLDGPCPAGDLCVNSVGSFSCETCPEGFVAGETNCQDIDECSAGTWPCDVTTERCVNAIGSYECRCLDGLQRSEDMTSCVPPPNRCTDGTHDCHPLATCVHEGATFACICNDTTYDNSSMGKNCISPVAVSCTATSITVQVIADYFESRHIDFDHLHLANPACTGVPTTRGLPRWTFEISDLAACGTDVRKNATHVTYSNMLSNDVTRGVVMGTIISVPFSCSYPSNMAVALPTPYQPQINVISIAGPNGTGTFVVEMNLFTDSTYASVNNDTTYATTDTIYVQVQLTADDESLVLLINDCWATPTVSGGDPNSYYFIEDGCPIPGRVADTVKVTSNGKGKTSHFQSQVFGFVDYNTTFLHCSVDLCAAHQGSDACMKNCNRTRRSVTSLERGKRSIGGDKVLSLGPFMERRNSSAFNPGRFFRDHLLPIIVGLASCVLLIVALILFVVVNGRRVELRILRRFFDERRASSSSRSPPPVEAPAIRNLHFHEAHLPSYSVAEKPEPPPRSSSFECSRV